MADEPVFPISSILPRFTLGLATAKGEARLFRLKSEFRLQPEE